MNPTSLLSGLGAAISAEPTLGGAGDSGESSPGTGDLFLALMTGLLGEQPADTGTAVEPTPVPEQTPGRPVAPVVAPIVAPIVAGDPGTVPPEQVERTDPQPEVVDPTQAPAAVVPAVLPVVLPPALLAQTMPVGSRPTVPTEPTGTPVVDAPTAPAPVTSADQAGRTADTDSPDPGQPEVPVATASTPTTQPTMGTPSASSPTTPQVAPVAGVAAPTPVAAPTAPASTDVHRVAEQVFPEVVRVSGSADGGPRRVTVKLNPEALGEVRVTLTQRGGELEVTLSAGHEARRALAEGTPELQRLLESVGRADSRVVIRDLPSSTTPVQPLTQDGSSLRTDVSTDLGGDAWSGAGRPGGEPAPDREPTRYATSGSTSATDGTPSATTPPRPTTTDQSHRSGGLDVSI